MLVAKKQNATASKSYVSSVATNVDITVTVTNTAYVGGAVGDSTRGDFTSVTICSQITVTSEGTAYVAEVVGNNNTRTCSLTGSYGVDVTATAKSLTQGEIYNGKYNSGKVSCEKLA